MSPKIKDCCGGVVKSASKVMHIMFLPVLINYKKKSTPSYKFTNFIHQDRLYRSTQKPEFIERSQSP